MSHDDVGYPKACMYMTVAYNRPTKHPVCYSRSHSRSPLRVTCRLGRGTGRPSWRRGCGCCGGGSPRRRPSSCGSTPPPSTPPASRSWRGGPPAGGPPPRRRRRPLCRSPSGRWSTAAAPACAAEGGQRPRQTPRRPSRRCGTAWLPVAPPLPRRRESAGAGSGRSKTRFLLRRWRLPRHDPTLHAPASVGM